MTIALLSGTSGSGKTYIVEQIMRELGPEQSTVALGPRSKPGALVWPGVTIMGKYGPACGGCDALSWKGASDDIERVVVSEVERGQKVILEGLLVGTWGVPRLTRLVPHGLTVIQLATSPEDCVAAVLARRAERARELGKELKELDPSNTLGKHHGLLSVLPRRREAGINVELLSRDAALARVRELLL
jgi:hypothetical protein